MTELEAYANNLLTTEVEASELRFGKADHNDVARMAEAVIATLRADHGVIELRYDEATMAIVEA